MSRTFSAQPAVRQQTPLLGGLTGPSGSGKTKSALRLATGIIKVRGGDIAVIDTEANRALHYAPPPGEKPDPARGWYDFKHIPFSAPFASTDYLEVIKYAAEVSRGGCVVIDSMSHEHEGAGGYLEYHDAEVERMSGGDASKAQRVQIGAWIRPAAARRKLINGILQINSSFIFCFRAKEKIKPVAGREPIPLGFQAIAGDEFVFEMTFRALLLPGAMGVPSWEKAAFEHNAAKLQEQHRDMFLEGKPLDEETGERLARWAQGAPVERISTDQLTHLRDELKTVKDGEARFVKVARIAVLEQLPANRYQDALAWVARALETA